MKDESQHSRVELSETMRPPVRDDRDPVALYSD